MTAQARAHVYFIRCSATDLVKVGFATHAKSRVADLQIGSAGVLTLERTIAAVDRMCEQRLHAVLAERRVRGEWFRLTRDEVAAIPDNLNLAELRLRGSLWEGLRDIGQQGLAGDVVNLVMASGIARLVPADRQELIAAVAELSKRWVRR